MPCRPCELGMLSSIEFPGATSLTPMPFSKHRILPPPAFCMIFISHYQRVDGPFNVFPRIGFPVFAEEFIRGCCARTSRTGKPWVKASIHEVTFGASSTSVQSPQLKDKAHETWRHVANACPRYLSSSRQLLDPSSQQATTRAIDFTTVSRPTERDRSRWEKD